MPITNHRISVPSSRETPAQREKRIAHERALLEEARQELRDGLALDEDEVDAWLDSLDCDNDHPLPEPQGGRWYKF